MMSGATMQIWTTCAGIVARTLSWLALTWLAIIWLALSLHYVVYWSGLDHENPFNKDDVEKLVWAKVILSIAVVAGALLWQLRVCLRRPPRANIVEILRLLRRQESIWFGVTWLLFVLLGLALYGPNIRPSVAATAARDGCGAEGGCEFAVDEASLELMMWALGVIVLAVPAWAFAWLLQVCRAALWWKSYRPHHPYEDKWLGITWLVFILAVPDPFLWAAPAGAVLCLLRVCLQRVRRAQLGEDLVLAATYGNESRVRELLQQPQAARANYKDGQALVVAVEHGHSSIVRLLLDWPVHAPRPDCQRGEALRRAREEGPVRIERLLLERQAASDAQTAARAAAVAQLRRRVRVHIMVASRLSICPPPMCPAAGRPFPHITLPHRNTSACCGAQPLEWSLQAAAAVAHVLRQVRVHCIALFIRLICLALVPGVHVSAHSRI
jgi:hypothetical protein